MILQKQRGFKLVSLSNQKKRKRVRCLLFTAPGKHWGKRKNPLKERYGFISPEIFFICLMILQKQRGFQMLPAASFKFFIVFSQHEYNPAIYLYRETDLYFKGKRKVQRRKGRVLRLFFQLLPYGWGLSSPAISRSIFPTAPSPAA